MPTIWQESEARDLVLMEGNEFYPRGETVSGNGELSDLTEDEIAVLLEKEIQTRTGRRVIELCVRPGNGHMVVCGHVKSYYVKQLVLATVMSVLEAKKIKAAFDVDVIS